VSSFGIPKMITERTNLTFYDTINSGSFAKGLLSEFIKNRVFCFSINQIRDFQITQL